MIHKILHRKLKIKQQ